MMGEEDHTLKRRRHTPEQVIRKLREADRMLGEGKTVPDVPMSPSGVRRDEAEALHAQGPEAVRELVAHRTSPSVQYVCLSFPASACTRCIAVLNWSQS